MKENCTIAKPHLVENFIQDLMSEHTEKEDTVIFTRVYGHHALSMVYLFILPVSQPSIDPTVHPNFFFLRPSIFPFI